MKVGARREGVATAVGSLLTLGPDRRPIAPALSDERACLLEAALLDPGLERFAGAGASGRLKLVAWTEKSNYKAHSSVR